MTYEGFATLIPTLRAKVLGMLIREFRRVGREECEDIAQGALTRASRQIQTFKEESGLLAYLYQSAKLDMIHYLQQKLERHTLLQGMPQAGMFTPAKRDPQTRRDRKIDLQRAIDTIANDRMTRRALWNHAYVGWSLEELAETLPSTRTAGGWIASLKRARVSLQRTMRVGGYQTIYGRPA